MALALPFTKRADDTQRSAYRALTVAQQRYEESGALTLVPAEFHETVLRYLKATQKRLARHHEYLQMQAYDAKEVGEGEAEQLADMLAEISAQLFPEPTKTFVDGKDSLAARVTQLSKGNPGFGDLRYAIADARREVAILLAWYRWYRNEPTHDPGGMFTALRFRYERTQVFADNLSAVAKAFDQIYTLVTKGTINHRARD